MDQRTIILNPKLINNGFEAPKLTLKILKLIVKWYSEQLILNEQNIYKTNNIYIKNSLIYIDIVILNDVVSQHRKYYIDELISNPDNCGKYPIIINDIEYKLTSEITDSNKIYILNLDLHCYDTVHSKSLVFSSFYKLKFFIKTSDVYDYYALACEEGIIDSNENIIISYYGNLKEYCSGNIEGTFFEEDCF